MLDRCNALLDRKEKMKTVNEILDSKKIYSEGFEISEDGIKGYIYIDGVNMTFIASWGGGWDHVSVAPVRRNKLPTWDQMCKVKEIFFRDDEAVIQIHPPEAEYVNNMSNCLHLWRANDKEMVLPPSFMVGFRKGQTPEELRAEIDKYYKEGGYQ